MKSNIKKLVALSLLASFLLASCSNNRYAICDHEYYKMKVAQFEEENKTISDVDICFLGDSLTDGYDVTSFYPEYKVSNRGIGGDNTFGLEKRLKVSCYDINPKVVVYWIGINNLDTMLENYESNIYDIEGNVPNAGIVLVSMTPNTWGRQEMCNKRNPEIEAIAKKHDHPYAYIFDALLDESTGTLKESYTIDGGHFSSEGYEVITSILKPIIASLLN